MEQNKEGQTPQEPVVSKEPQGKLYAVYGTLRKGFNNNRLLQNKYCTRLGKQTTEAKYKMVHLGGFPGVIPNGTQSIVIEVWRVDSEEVDKRLDWLEGYPSFYQKMEIDTNWGKATMYILSEEKYGNSSVVNSGDWAIATGTYIHED